MKTAPPNWARVHEAPAQMQERQHSDLMYDARYSITESCGRRNFSNKAVSWGGGGAKTWLFVDKKPE